MYEAAGIKLAHMLPNVIIDFVPASARSGYDVSYGVIAASWYGRGQTDAAHGDCRHHMVLGPMVIE